MAAPEDTAGECGKLAFNVLPGPEGVLTCVKEDGVDAHEPCRGLERQKGGRASNAGRP